MADITPPPELVQQWKRTAPHQSNKHEHYHYITLCAAQWGAEQELEACCELLQQKGIPAWSLLRLHRRPKPPSLKEQALALIDDCTDPEGDYLDDNALSIIRCALEALPND